MSLKSKTLLLFTLSILIFSNGADARGLFRDPRTEAIISAIRFYTRAKNAYRILSENDLLDFIDDCSYSNSHASSIVLYGVGYCIEDPEEYLTNVEIACRYKDIINLRIKTQRVKKEDIDLLNSLPPYIPSRNCDVSVENFWKRVCMYNCQ